MKNFINQHNRCGVFTHNAPQTILEAIEPHTIILTTRPDAWQGGEVIEASQNTFIEGEPDMIVVDSLDLLGGQLLADIRRIDPKRLVIVAERQRLNNPLTLCYAMNLLGDDISVTEFTQRYLECGGVYLKFKEGAENAIKQRTKDKIFYGKQEVIFLETGRMIDKLVALEKLLERVEKPVIYCLNSVQEEIINIYFSQRGIGGYECCHKPCDHKAVNVIWFSAPYSKVQYEKQTKAADGIYSYFLVVPSEVDELNTYLSPTKLFTSIGEATCRPETIRDLYPNYDNL